MRFVLLIAWLAAAAPVAASDHLWSALVFATNEKPTEPMPRKLETFAPTIRQVFGYRWLTLLGDKRQELQADQEIWLVPSKDFFFEVHVLETAETHYRIRLQLFHRDQSILTSTVRLARGAPLYIRGPQWGNGQLLLVLEIR
ncbi:MAG: hypothetical protein SFU53_02040 [Terrimicrobiaceae bacterium]|nr:hypothetical protein [Terrimicrobiaceae bacterium]